MLLFPVVSGLDHCDCGRGESWEVVVGCCGRWAGRDRPRMTDGIHVMASMSESVKIIRD